MNAGSASVRSRHPSPAPPRHRSPSPASARPFGRRRGESSRIAAPSSTSSPTARATGPAAVRPRRALPGRSTRREGRHRGRSRGRQHGDAQRDYRPRADRSDCCRERHGAAAAGASPASSETSSAGRRDVSTPASRAVSAELRAGSGRHPPIGRAAGTASATTGGATSATGRSAREGAERDRQQREQQQPRGGGLRKRAEGGMPGTGRAACRPERRRSRCRPRFPALPLTPCPRSRVGGVGRYASCARVITVAPSASTWAASYSAMISPPAARATPRRRVRPARSAR